MNYREELLPTALLPQSNPQLPAPPAERIASWPAVPEPMTAERGEPGLMFPAVTSLCEAVLSLGQVNSWP